MATLQNIERRTNRLKGLAFRITAPFLRLLAFVLAVTTVVTLVSYRRAGAQLDEAMLELGDGLMEYDAARHQDAPRGLVMNGQRLFLRSGTTDDGVAAVLDHYQAVLDRDGAEAGFRVERFEQGRQRVIEQRVAGLQRGAASEVQPEEPGERKFLRPTLLVDGAFALQIERPLNVDDRLPLGRRFRVAGDETAALIVDALAEAGEHDIVETLQPFAPTHRLG